MAGSISAEECSTETVLQRVKGIRSTAEAEMWAVRISEEPVSEERDWVHEGEGNVRVRRGLDDK